MKSYMMIFLGADYEQSGGKDGEVHSRMDRWRAWEEKMRKADIIRGGNALHSSVCRIEGPDRIVSDRAGSEIKELVGGYFIVAAENMDEVVTISQGYPLFDVGGKVEIRELKKFDR